MQIPIEERKLHIMKKKMNSVSVCSVICSQKTKGITASSDLATVEHWI